MPAVTDVRGGDESSLQYYLYILLAVPSGNNCILSL